MDPFDMWADTNSRILQFIEFVGCIPDEWQPQWQKMLLDAYEKVPNGIPLEKWQLKCHMMLANANGKALKGTLLLETTL